MAVRGLENMKANGQKDVVTKQEAIDETLKLMDPYLKQDRLNDAQAARIGRTLWANLRQAERDAETIRT